MEMRARKKTRTMPDKTSARLGKEIPRLYLLRKLKREAETEEKELVADIRPEVIAFGEHGDEAHPNDAVLIFGSYKVHNCASVREGFNMPAGIAFMRKKIEELADKPGEQHQWQLLLTSLLVVREDIDTETFRKAALLKLVPDELMAAVMSQSVTWKLLVHENK